MMEYGTGDENEKPSSCENESHHQAIQSMKGSSLERTQDTIHPKYTGQLVLEHERKGNRAHLEALFSILSCLQWSSRHSRVQHPLTQNFMTSRILALSTKNFAKSTCGFSPLYDCSTMILRLWSRHSTGADGSQCTASFRLVVSQLV